MNEEKKTEEQSNEKSPKNWLSTLKRYKLHLSVAAAVLVVSGSALVHYKNERVQEELVKAIDEYRKGLLLIGAEIGYDALGCSGIFSTDCEIEGIKLSMLGQEQLSIKSLRLGNVEDLEALKGFSEGKSVNASIDIEIDEAVLPKPFIAQLVAQNVSNAFQQNTLDKLSTLSLALKADIEGSSALIQRLAIDCLKIDNAIMPIEFAMEASDIAGGSPESMVLRNFSLSAENRAISDVTYESVNSFALQLSPEEKNLFLKEFGLRPADMGDKTKASQAINAAIAKRFETDLATTSGVVEKELIRAMIAMLKGDVGEIVLKGENKERYTMAQVQSFLLRSSGMKEEEAKQFMEDKFVIEVETD